jgi:DNA-binding beta-propeller fold protein YncE
MPAVAGPRSLAPGLALALAALVLAALGLAACGQPGARAGRAGAAAVRVMPERIVNAPANLLAASAPTPDGAMWALAGRSATGLYKVNTATGRLTRSVSVSNAARSVADSPAGVIGVALGSGRAGALQLLDGRTAAVIRTVPLPAPARDVTVGGDAFYVLTGWANSASVTIVSPGGRVRGTVPVPADAVSIAADIQQSALYVLQRAGPLYVIGIARGKIEAEFGVGGTGLSLAMSPGGATLYVLKGTSRLANIAVVKVSTESVTRVLPAPSDCREVLVSGNGRQLYEIVGTAHYGNIQVFAA